MTLALVPELKCACGGALDPTEEGVCSFCRMQQRGDDRLVCHDSRGWLGEKGERVPCRCGCGMLAVPEPDDAEPEPVVVPLLAPPSEEADTRARMIEALRAYAEEHGEAPSIAIWQRGERKPSVSTASRLFGTWSNAVRAAGLEPHAQHGTGEALRTFEDREAADADRPREIGLEALATVIDSETPLEVKFRHEPAEHGRKLLERLGATYTIAADAPPCASACGHPECKEDAMDDGREALRRMDAGEPVKVSEPVRGSRDERAQRGRKMLWTKERIIAAVKAHASEHGRPPSASDWGRAAQDHPSANSVIARFGSWGAGIEAAGFARPIQGRRHDARPLPDPAPAPPAFDELRTSALALIFHVRSFLDEVEVELRRV